VRGGVPAFSTRTSGRTSPRMRRAASWSVMSTAITATPSRWRSLISRVRQHLLVHRVLGRPVYGGTARFQDDPHWRDLILFYEYFHGDNGAGLGASHQTGWTSLVAPLLDLFGRVDAKTLLEVERGSILARVVREQVGGEPARKG
jgi:hypothetical protein